MGTYEQGKRQPALSKLSISLLVLAALVVVVNWLVPSPSHRDDSRGEPFAISGHGFRPNAVYRSVERPSSRPGLALYGSWLNSDDSTGQVVSNYFPVHHQLAFWIAGYPRRRGNKLSLELVARDGSTTKVVPAWPEARESWVRYAVKLDAAENYTKARLIASDESKGPQGWFGFSAPIPPLSRIRRLLVFAHEYTRVLLAELLCLVLFVGPGLWAKRRQWTSPRWRILGAFAPLLGMGASAFVGLVVWMSAGFAPPGLLSLACILAAISALAFTFRRSELRDLCSSHELRALLGVALVVAVATAKATFSLGPPGELYGGTISRTLEVGDRSDSRISYHLVQLVAHGDGPIGAIADSYFAPWHFTSRGPLPGLAAAPLVLGLNTRPAREMPDAPWTIFDQGGFAAYRIAMMTMGACAFWSFFALLAHAFGSARPALFGMFVAIGCPFLLHEVYFTWPKLAMAGWVMAAALLLLEGKHYWAGITLGIAYLFHPAALLSIPALAGLLLLRRGTRRHWWSTLLERTTWRQGGGFGLGLFVCLAAWRLVNYREFAQGVFLDYLKSADGRAANTLSAWVAGRITSVLNTLLPGHLLFWHADHRSINSIYGPSPDYVHFFFQYWNTLPFGFGIALFPALLVALDWAIRRRTAQFFWLAALPFTAFAIYWGSFATGMMREGLHVFVFALCYFFALAFYAEDPHALFLRRTFVLGSRLRAVEVFLMLVLPAMLGSGRLISKAHPYSDAFSLLLMLVGLFLLARQTEGAYLDACGYQLESGLSEDHPEANASASA